MSSLTPDDFDRNGAPGNQLGAYRLVREIGRGGQATVYLAEDTRLRRQVALKVIESGVAGSTAAAFARLRREAEITSKLDHPGICPVYDTGEERGVRWIAMRYVEGETLARRIANAKSATDRHRSDWADINGHLLLFEKAARALHTAHEAGVIHRDIKPGNVIVTSDGESVLLDFGLAQDVGDDQPSLTITGDLVGTPAYMSPEQITARRVRLDRRTDVYSLGVSLYECLALARPFDAPTRDGLYQAILTKDPPDLRRLNPAVTNDLRVVVSTAIEKDRDRRYQTALDLAEDLRRARLHEPIVAKPVGPLGRLARWAQRNPALATAVGGLFAVLVAGLAVSLVLLRQRDRALSDYDRLGDLSRLQTLRGEAEALWPCTPANVDAMKAWLVQGEDLERRLRDHQASLDRLSAGALDSTAAHFKHDTTARLVAELTAFVDPDPGKGLLADVRRRLAFAETVTHETIDKYAEAWQRAIAAIAANPKYGGLRIEPQLGLIPLDADPHSGLWEFVHLQSAAPGADPIPRRGRDGRLIVTEDMGLVFVLIPGGTFRMGATPPADGQSPTAPNVDPGAHGDEAPVSTVTLGPYFMSKYELTQGQWLRMTGSNPSQYRPQSKFGGKTTDLGHPVENVSWLECRHWSDRLGLVLPTEAQWEYAARAGTTTPRWTGVGTDGLARAANLADQFCRLNGGLPTWSYVSWSDGYSIHAPVGSFEPNPFGLHDVLGNVFEWCRDWMGNYGIPTRPSDGLREHDASGPLTRVYRGGSWVNDGSRARSAIRNYGLPEYRNSNLGVRPARAVDHD